MSHTTSKPHERADWAQELGALVRSRRRDLRLGQTELGDLAGVSARFVYAVEMGKSTVQLDKLLLVLDAVGLHLEVQLGGTPRPVTQSADDTPAST